MSTQGDIDLILGDWSRRLGGGEQDGRQLGALLGRIASDLTERIGVVVVVTIALDLDGHTRLLGYPLPVVNQGQQPGRTH